MYKKKSEAASMPVSYLAKTYSVPVHLMTSSFRTETTLLPIFRKTSPIPMGRSAGFLSNGIKRQDRKASVVWVSTRPVHNFGLYLEMPHRDHDPIFQNYWKLEF